MADIKLTPEQLLAQYTEMTAVKSEFESLFTQVTSALNGLNESWSEALSGNFSGKITAAQKSFSSVVSMMENGAKAAQISANGFASPGSVLALLCGGDAGSVDRLSDLTAWIHENRDKLGTGMDTDMVISALSEMTGIDMSDAQNIIEKIADGDVEGVLKTIGDKGLDWAAGGAAGEIGSDTWVGQLQKLTGGKLGLDGLEKSYYKNLVSDTAGNMIDIVKEQYFGEGDIAKEANLLGQMAWNLSAGSVIKTGADAAFNVVKDIPIIGDYYANKGVTDGEGAIGSMIGDITYMVTGDRQAANADGSYYKEHGGIAKGMADGVGDIASYVGSKISEAWHSAFGNNRGKIE